MSNSINNSKISFGKSTLLTGLSSNRIFRPDEIDLFIFRTCGKQRAEAGNYRKVKYYEIPASFDIESTSFIQDDLKCATMYIWTFSIYGYIMMGRSWLEWVNVVDKLSEKLGLTDDKRFIIWIHNLSFEFQFMRKWFTWVKVFAIDALKPAFAVTDNGIEFRCSYILSGYGLAKLGETLTKYKCEKLVGDLDYSLFRHSKTPLKPHERKYCINDVRVVVCYIQELIEKFGSISKLPYTKTGFVRNECREACLYTEGMSHKESRKQKKYKRYRALMDSLTLDPKQYEHCKRAFAGGFTHCNPIYSGKVLSNMDSEDETSAYPAQMFKRRFPMSRGEWVQIKGADDFYNNLKYYCCIFTCKFTGLKPKVRFENYLSYSHCWGVKNEILNNGRIVSCDEAFTTITEIDFELLQKFYTWEQLKVYDFLRFERGYLPEDLLRCVLRYYNDKTRLKGVLNADEEYMWAKSNLNSIFGCMVTDICRDENVYEGDEWCNPKKPDIEKVINKYNKDPQRFLFYPWGIYITALNRAVLMGAILECKWDYVYSDTDSVKMLNYGNHKSYFDKYNEAIDIVMKQTCKHYNIDYSLTRPKTIKGEEKPLGAWDYDGHYIKFKSLGAKRYMTLTIDKEQKIQLSLTVSGLNKRVAVPYIFRTCGRNFKRCFDFFSENMEIDEAHTGKNTHSYIDDEMSGHLTDYLGNTQKWHEKSAVNLSGASYSLSLAQDYANYLEFIQGERIEL